MGVVTSELDLSTVLVDRDGYVGRIILNRPDVLNALSIDVFEDIHKAVDAVQMDHDVRIVVFSGAGRVFSSGTDLTSLGKMGLNKRGADSNKDFRAIGRKLQAAFDSIEGMEKPTIAMLHGYALGGACELSLACDIRIASENVIMGFPEIDHAIVSDLGGCYRLPRLVGIGKAKELMFTGDRISGTDAFAIGLVNYAVPEDKLEETAMDLARKIASKAPIAVGLLKKLIIRSFEMDLVSFNEYALYAQSCCIQSKDVVEAVAARMEKREPNFKGK